MVVGIVCAVGVTLSLLGVAGWVPGALPASPIVFAQDGRIWEGPVNQSWSFHSETHLLPAWARVHFSWNLTSAATRIWYRVVGPMGGDSYSSIGNNGSGSFASVGGAYVFSVAWAGFFGSPPNTTTCLPVVLEGEVTYSR